MRGTRSQEQQEEFLRNECFGEGAQILLHVKVNGLVWIGMPLLALAAAAIVTVAISPLIMVAAPSHVVPASMLPLQVAQARQSPASDEPKSQPTMRARYDIASIKPNNDNDFRFVFRFEPGGRLAATGITLRRLMMTAYEVQGFRIIGGPDWVSSKQWDIQATPDRAVVVSPAQVWSMLRALLESRFQLHVHSEIRQLPVYELSVDQGGSKVPAVKDSEAKPEVRNGRGSILLTHNTPATFASQLSYALNRPVIDKTNLSGQFDFALRWSPAPGEDGGPTTSGLPPHVMDQPAPASDGPSIFTALREQLGLRLKAARGPVKVIAIDSVQLPTPN